MYEEDITRLYNMLDKEGILKVKNMEAFKELIAQVFSVDYSDYTEREKDGVKRDLSMRINNIKLTIGGVENKHATGIADRIKRELILIIDRSHA